MKKLSKKAQGLSFRVIIVAALGLLVLIVLVIMFTGKTRTFLNQTTETEQTYSANRCETPGINAHCRTESSCRAKSGAVSLGKKDCGGNNICCSQ